MLDIATLTPQAREKLTLLATDLPVFASHCLRIIDKQGRNVPFVFNQAQRVIHDRLEAQKRRTGRVRAIIIKGRQEGCTTYTQARYFHRALFTPNQSAYILAHQAESTLKIYSMANRFYTNLPKGLQFPLLKDTEKAMAIENGSSYTVGTAGSAQVGRGMTVQLFHGSEVAFYENSDELSTGLMQTVADLPGTEMILESTANGPGNFFHTKCMQAIEGKGEFELIFIPWYWMDEYQSPPLADHQLTDKERQILEAHKDDPIHPLTLANLAWRRKKILEFDEKEWKFNQEYPCTVQEAFVFADERFFDMRKLQAARGRKQVLNDLAPLIIGVDQGRTGDDTKIRRRQGTVLFPIETIRADDGRERDMRLAGRLASIIERERPDMVFIDTTNEHGALDRLHELGYNKIVRGIHFGEQALDNKRYRNKRTEMYFLFREWMDDPEASIPNEERFITECGAIPKEKETSNSLQFLETKDNIKKALTWSPDELDATVLTFAYPVRKRPMTLMSPATRAQRSQPSSGFRSQLATLKGVR